MRDRLSGRPIVVNIGNFDYEGGFRFGESRTREYVGEYPREYELKAGDLLIAMTCQTPGGEVLGVPGRIPSDGRTYLHNQRLGKVVIKRSDLVDTGWLHCMFRSPLFHQYLVATASGTMILHTSPDRIKDYRLDLPPLVTQRAVAAVLGALDAKIEVNRHIARVLDAAVMSAYRSVAARTESSLPVDRVADIRGGSTPSTESPKLWNPGVHFWATPKDMTTLHSPVLWRTERKISDAGLESISSGLLPQGTVLLSSRAPIGYVAIAAMPIAMNQGFIALVPSALLSSEYLCCWVRASMSAIEALANGTTFMEVSKRSFRTLRVAVPSDSLLSEFDSLAKPTFLLMLSLERQDDRLSSLRDLLLPRLTSGELAVPEAERAIGSAV